ncbi:hypothetical protein [Leisingera methylohalidivorans]|uniref:Argininosuccinate lyase n=1 Tax=Leisingera methylohalidivorans DSM 14336 TaxID=999552 RepID=V9W062_9RHOB|nr:hypothetical protein [Leisingera methylohalidivorans]AHD03030.1 hypothetical protein METH_09045 [Leisingera methylohalidivorans DSM 14336]
MYEALILAVLLLAGASASACDIGLPQPEEDLPETEPREKSDRLQLGDEAGSINAGSGKDLFELHRDPDASATAG